MTTIYAHRCMIVPLGYAPTTRDLCKGMADSGAGDNMFLVPLSPTGNLPATHFISAGAQAVEFCEILPLKAYSKVPGQEAMSLRPGKSAEVVSLAGKKGMPVTKGNIDALFEGVEVTEEPWQVAIDRMGLRVIRGTLP